MTTPTHPDNECSLPDCFCHVAQRLERGRSDGRSSASSKTINGHLLYTEQNCSVFHDSDKQCPVCEGGLAVCRLCVEYEAGLDKPCSRAQSSVVVAPTFTEEWESAPRAMIRYVEQSIAEYWFLRGVRAGEAAATIAINGDLKELRRVAAERIEQRWPRLRRTPINK